MTDFRGESTKTTLVNAYSHATDQEKVRVIRLLATRYLDDQNSFIEMCDVLGLDPELARA